MFCTLFNRSDGSINQRGRTTVITALPQMSPYVAGNFIPGMQTAPAAGYQGGQQTLPPFMQPMAQR